MLGAAVSDSQSSRVLASHGVPDDDPPYLLATPHDGRERRRTVEPVAVLPEDLDQDHLGWVDDQRLLSMVPEGRRDCCRFG